MHLEQTLSEFPSSAPAIVVAELGPGEVVGEDGMFDGQVCPTTVVAVETVEALQISRLAIALTVLQYPDVCPVLLKAVQQQRSASYWATLGLQ